MANNINIDSKHLPKTAAAWQAPAVLNIIAGWTFLTIMTIMGVTWFVQYTDSIANPKKCTYYESYRTPGRLAYGPDHCAPYNPKFIPPLR